MLSLDDKPKRKTLTDGSGGIPEDDDLFRYEEEGRGIRCPACGNLRTRVLNNYRNKHGGIRRERQCLYCRARFSTEERRT